MLLLHCLQPTHAIAAALLEEVRVTRISFVRAHEEGIRGVEGVATPTSQVYSGIVGQVIPVESVPRTDVVHEITAGGRHQRSGCRPQARRRLERLHLIEAR